MSSIRIRTKAVGTKTLVRIMIEHPMETGRRKDTARDAVIPAHYITELRIEHNHAPILHGALTTAVSKNPYFSFRLSNAKAGDTLRVSWKDNLGNTDTLESTLSHDNPPSQE